ncbi:MAG: hypothetical protein U9R79_04685 [Armatimonadota bacterium]|nr:hypothetical protein [Armatimonadota bacterium]
MTAGQLNALLNCLPESVALHLPLVSVDAFSLQFAGADVAVRIVATRAGYQTSCSGIASRVAWSSFSGELPSYRLLVDCLTMSGVVPLHQESEAELAALFTALNRPEPHSFDIGLEDHIFLGFDTNCFRKCFLSTYIFPRLMATRGPRRWDLVISEYNISEISHRISTKYQPVHADAMQGLGTWVRSVFAGQPRLDARLRKLGLVQYRRALEEYRAQRAPKAASDRSFRDDLNRAAELHTDDPAAGYDARTAVVDQYIARSYGEFAAEAKTRKVIFLTFDRGAADACAGYEGLLPVTLTQQPLHEIDGPVTCSWEAAGSLLEVLARVFGRVDLRDDNSNPLCSIDGVWRPGGPERRSPCGDDDLLAGALWLSAPVDTALGEARASRLARYLDCLSSIRLPAARA